MKVLDLFSGIGGFSLGLERAGMETVAFCEYDEKCRQVLKKHWPDVPQYNDVRTLTDERLREDGITDIGLICGGYPCQPFSLAGKREGEADDRHLWPEFFRLIQEIRPPWVLCENVAGHITMGLDSVLADLESEGYTSQSFVIPAVSVGAFHRRDRVWIVAHSDEKRRRGMRCGGAGKQHTARVRSSQDNDAEPSGDGSQAMAHSDSLDGGADGRTSNAGTNGWNKSRGGGEDVAHTSSKGLQGRQKFRNARGCGAQRNEQLTGRGECAESSNWLSEPDVGRVAHGVPGRVDRLKQLGNAVVPQIPEMIGRAIMEAEYGF